MRVSLTTVCTVAGLVFSQAALAADLPMKVKAPPPPPAPVLSWTGWYVGLNAGAIWTNNDGVSHTAVAELCVPSIAIVNAVCAVTSPALARGSNFNAGFGNNAGFTGGGQFGWNWQFNSWGVAGFEADIAWTDQNRSVTFASVTPIIGPFSEVYTATVSRHLDYIGTARGRFGFLATPSLLLYGTGGLAYGGARSSTTETANVLPFCFTIAGATCPTGFGRGSFSETRAGWTAGAGGEWMFAPNWSAKVEYLYYDLGRVNYATNLSQLICGAAVCFPIANTTGVTSLRFTGSIARVGVNWHFNGPILAKY